MPERLPTGRFWVLSVAVHAAALSVLGYALVTPSGPEPAARVETAMSFPTILEESLPPLERTTETIPAGQPGPVAFEGEPGEAVDPRFASSGTGAAASPAEAPGPIGLGGGGGRRVGARRAAAAPPPPPAEEPPPAPVVLPDPVPEVRALPVAGACEPPVYPSRERRLGIEGVVTVRVEVAADGSVASAAVEEGSGSGPLDEAALAAVRRWRFEPARTAGAAVPDTFVQGFRFRLVSAAVHGRQ